MFTPPILDFIRSSVAAQVFGVIRGGRLNLGGTSGSYGGSGTPPGGFDGLLIQRAIAYDSTEEATLSGNSSLLDNLNHIRYNIANAGSGSIWTRLSGSIYPSTLTDDLGLGTASPEVRLDVSGSGIFALYNTSNAVQYPLTLRANAVTATPSSLETGIRFQGGDDSVQNRDMGYIRTRWQDYSDATRTSFFRFFIMDSGAPLEIVRLQTGLISLNTFTFVGDLESGNNVTLANHLLNEGGLPGIVADAGAGSGASVSIAGTDMAGQIILTAGTAPAAGSSLLTVTFAQPYSTAPFMLLSPRNSNAALLSGTTMVYIRDVTATDFNVVSGTVSLSGSLEYIWDYFASGVP